MNVWRGGWLRWSYLPNWKTNIRHFFKCFKWSYQRIARGYADCDVWDLDCYLTDLISSSIDTLAEISHSYPGDDTPEGSTPEKWREYLHNIAELLRHSKENYYYKNEFENEHMKSFEKWTYENNSIYFNESDEDKNISKRYFEREKEIFEQRNSDLLLALEYLGKRWWSLWD